MLKEPKIPTLDDVTRIVINKTAIWHRFQFGTEYPTWKKMKGGPGFNDMPRSATKKTPEQMLSLVKERLHRLGRFPVYKNEDLQVLVEKYSYRWWKSEGTLNIVRRDLPQPMRITSSTTSYKDTVCTSCNCHSQKLPEGINLTIDGWRALRAQKMILLNLIEGKHGNDENALEGMINLLDLLQDNAIRERGIPGTDVFTHRELHAAGIKSVDEAPFVIFDVWSNSWLDGFATMEAAEKQQQILVNKFGIACQICTKETWEEIKKEKENGS